MMKSIVVSVAAMAIAFLAVDRTEAQDWRWQAQNNHFRHHQDLEHREFHRYQYHAQAHQYPMNYFQHNRLHNQLNYDRFRDQVEHSWAHGTNAYVPRYSNYGYGGSACYRGSGFSIQFGW